MTTPTRPGGLRAEAKILFACARPRLDPAQIARLRDLLQGPVDWDQLITLAEHHRVLPLLGRHLDREFAALVPEGVRSRYGRVLRAKLAQSFLLAEELRRVLQHFAQQGIPALAYKGPVLAQQIYGDIALRTFGDLDILVRPADLGRARHALLNLNYRVRRPLSPIQQTALRHTECDEALVNQGNRVVVELHWALTPPHFSFPLDPDPLLARAVLVDLAGQPVTAPADEDLIILLALNGGKDLWQRLEPAALLAHLCAVRTTIDWTTVLDRARAVRGERLLRLALAIAIRLLDARPPPSVRRWIDHDPALPGLLEPAITRLAAGVDRAGLLQATWIRVRSREHWADGLRHCLMRAVLPNANDCGVLPGLPAVLWPATALVRPVRLLARRFARSTRSASD